MSDFAIIIMIVSVASVASLAIGGWAPKQTVRLKIGDVEAEGETVLDVEQLLDAARRFRE